ncbi:hypothetical protein Tco_0522669 [Tanacetum coccineum]
MTARDKTSLGYGTQLNEMSNNSESDSEISLSAFDVRSSDEESTLENDRFSKADGYHVVPSPITGNFLTLRDDISFAGLDEYAIRKKIIESKTIELNADTSKSKTNDEDNLSEVKQVIPGKTRDFVAGIMQWWIVVAPRYILATKLIFSDYGRLKMEAFVAFWKESLERDIDGTEELLLPDLLILWLTKVSTDSAKLVPLGKDSTAIKPLEKIPPRV